MKEAPRPDVRQLGEQIARGAAPTVTDRIVNWLDPVKGLARARARYAQAMIGGYIGGSRSRRATSEWRTRAASADADLLPDLPTLWERSRDLERNSPIAGGAINTIATNVVGTGLMLQSRVNRAVLGMNEEEASAWQTKAELEFQLFSRECDITRTQPFYELQDLVFRGALQSGDCFSLLPSLRRPGDVYALKIQVIEADRVSNPKFTMDRPELAGGVEMDQFGAPVAYHILRQHPGDLLTKAREWDRYPAFGEKTGRRNVLHHFRRLRIGSSRGEPLLAPVIEPLKQLDRYTEAEIMAAVIAGMFTVFVHSAGGNALEPAAPNSLGKETGAKSSDADIKMASGAIVDLGEADKVDFANPGRPNAAYDPFVMSILRQIGMRLGLPYEVLIMHFTASYSAARAALLQAWRFFMVRREWLACSFCQPVYEACLAEAIAGGRIAAPGFFSDPLIRMAYCGAEWQGDGMPAIDPEKEVSAAEKRMELTMTTLQDETAAYNGRDWQANVEQAAREREKRKAAGLLPEPAPAASPARPQPDEPANPDNPGGYDTPGAVAELVSAFGAEIRARDAVILPAMTRSSEALAAAAAREIPAAPAPVVNFHEGAFRIEHRAGDTHVTVPERSVSVTAPVAPLPPPTRQTIVRDSAGEIASIITRPIGED